MNYPKQSWLKISRGFSGWECRSSSVGQFQLRVSLSQGCSHLMARLGLEDPFPRWFAHMNDQLVPMVLLAGSFRFSPQSPLYGLLESPHGMLSDFLQSKWPKRPRWNLQCLLWPTFKVVHHHSCSIPLVIQTNTDSAWEEAIPLCQ